MSEGEGKMFYYTKGGLALISWCRKMRIKNVRHSLRILGFASRSTPSLHLHFISHPMLIIPCLSDVKRVFHPHHSSYTVNSASRADMGYLTTG